MHEQDLVDLDAAQRLADRLNGYGIRPEGGADLRRFVRELNALALRASRRLDLAWGIRFTVCPIIKEHEELKDLDPDDDILYDDRPCTVVGYKVFVAPVARPRLEQIHHRDRQRRETARRHEAERRARRLRGPRRRGAGRPGHRSRARANAPPAGDEPAEPEPPLSPARQTRRAVCRLWWQR